VTAFQQIVIASHTDMYTGTRTSSLTEYNQLSSQVTVATGMEIASDGLCSNNSPPKPPTAHSFPPLPTPLPLQQYPALVLRILLELIVPVPARRIADCRSTVVPGKSWHPGISDFDASIKQHQKRIPQSRICASLKVAMNFLYTNFSSSEYMGSLWHWSVRSG